MSGNGRAEKRLPFLNFSDCPANIVAGGLFKYIAYGTRLHRISDIGIIAVRREYEHFGGGKCFEHLPGSLQTVEQGHRNVHQCHVGTKFFGQRDCLTSVLRFADHFKVGFEFEHLAKSFAHNHMIFRQQHRDSFHKEVPLIVVVGGGKGMHISISVPVRPVDLTLKAPPT